MNEQTQRLITALLSTPELLKSVRRDPISFATKVMRGELCSPLTEAVKELAGRINLSGVLQTARTPSVSASKSAPAIRGKSVNGLASITQDVPIVSILSLGAIMGAIAVLSTVTIVAVAHDDGPQR